MFIAGRKVETLDKFDVWTCSDYKKKRSMNLLKYLFTVDAQCTHLVN